MRQCLSGRRQAAENSLEDLQVVGEPTGSPLAEPAAPEMLAVLVRAVPFEQRPQDPVGQTTSHGHRGSARHQRTPFLTKSAAHPLTRPESSVGAADGRRGQTLRVVPSNRVST